MPHFVPKDEKAARKYVPFWTADGPPDTTEIPTYLFRLTGPSTDGTTTQSFICPPKPQNENLLDLNSCDAAGRLVQHFRWKSEHIAHCNFMSWSSSLLFLLQYAFYRYETQSGDRNFDKIKLLVVDTTAFPKGTFAKDLDLIKKLDTGCGCSRHQDLSDFNDMRKGRSRYYFGEYITQGALDIFENEGIQVNFQEMRNRKLCQLLPNDLKEENWGKWASIVVSARDPFRYIKSPPASEKEIRAAITIAKDLFKGPWSLPVAAMLLGLKPRQRNDPVIVKGLIKGYGVDAVRESISQRLIIDGARLPEVQQYRYIIDDIVANVLENDEPAPSDTGSSTDDECSSVDNLTSDVASRLTLD